MSEARNGWTFPAIGEICELNPRHPRNLDDDMEVSFVPMAAVSENSPQLDTSQTRRLGDVRKGYTHFAEGDILFAKITPCMENGKAAIATKLTNGIGCGTTELHVLRPKPGVDPRYVYHYIHQSSFRDEAKRNFTGTAGQLRVPVDFIRNSTIPLAPPDEQHRIVAKLEALLARVNAARERLDKIPTLLKRFRQAVLTAACTGQLTADWRATQTNIAQNPEAGPSEDYGELPESWRWATLDSACEKIVDCPHSTPRWATSGYICVRTTNFRPGALDLTELRYVSEATYQERIERLRPQAGDVLYSREGGILGVACIVPPEIDVCLGQRMMLFRASQNFDGAFLMNWLNSPQILRRVAELTGGSASPHLNVGDIRRFPIPQPPLEEQQEIVFRARELFVLSERLEARHLGSVMQVNNLAHSVLAQAFRGELVPEEAEEGVLSFV